MKTKLAVTAILSFTAGYGVHLAMVSKNDMPTSVAEHWQVVKAYQSLIMNPTNVQYDAAHGLSYINVPSGPEPSLFALVNVGQLNYVNLVFPNITDKGPANQLWMKFVNDHPDILHATGNPTYSDYQTTGTQPLHLSLWFRPAAKDSVRRLIQELEALGGTKSGGA